MGLDVTNTFLKAQHPSEFIEASEREETMEVQCQTVETLQLSKKELLTFQGPSSVLG